MDYFITGKNISLNTFLYYNVIASIKPKENIKLHTFHDKDQKTQATV